jgi:hypothetical protein
MAFNAFKAPNTVVNGGGFVGEKTHFNLNGVENAAQTTGHVQYGDDGFDVGCVETNGNSAILVSTDGTECMIVSDGGKKGVDYISGIIPTDEFTTCTTWVPALANQAVSGGNITVH